MILVSKFFNGIDFGSLGSAAAKAFGLILVTTAMSVYLGIFGALVGLACWIAGLMVLFKLQFVEAIVLAVINGLLIRLFAGALVTALR